MQEGTKRTIIWETNSEPPRNYIWIRSDGFAYEYNWDIREWILSPNLNRGGTAVVTKTTAEWNADTTYIPAKGEIIVYSDRKTVIRDGQPVLVPGVKIGSGDAYVRDLAFIDEGHTDIDINDHINNTEIHTNAHEKNFWSGKVSIDYSELASETLIFKIN